MQKAPVKTRHFNRLYLDQDRSVVRKESLHTQSLTDEINWYLKLPETLKYFVPRVFGYDLSETAPSIDIEFVDYPSLSESYLYGNDDLTTWNRVFDAIEKVLAEMTASKPISAEADAVHDALHQMYYVKTIDRLAKFAWKDEFAEFQQDTLVINGRESFGLDRTIDILPRLIEKAGLYKTGDFCIIHGDFCLSNILYDRAGQNIRLVDPRGSFGSFDIYGDQRYDIAKLMHSMEGDYDFIVNGLFDVDWKSKEHVCITIHKQAKHKHIQSLFSDRMPGEWKDEYLQIKLIESLLFLSMVPLHYDSPESQQAFLGQGLGLASDIAKRLGLQ